MRGNSTVTDLTPPADTVERVARALIVDEGRDPDALSSDEDRPLWYYRTHVARVAITAMSPPAAVEAEVREALYMARSWLGHANTCQMLAEIGEPFDEEPIRRCTCDLSPKLARIDAAIAAAIRSGAEAEGDG